MKKHNPPGARKLNFAEAFTFLILFIGFLIWAAMIAKIPTGMSVLLCGVMAGAYGMFVLHISWDTFFESIQKIFVRGVGAILILLFVGVIVGSWLAAGTTPMLIYYGLKLISPAAFLVIAFLLCTIVGMATGSAWSVMGSFGVALMGVALGLGINPALAGAAIASGSYIGDMWSPFSDVPNLTSALTKGTSFDIFRAEFPYVIPAIITSVIAYFLLGLSYRSGNMDFSLITPILEGLESTYQFNIFLLIPAIFVIIGGILKWPALPTLFGSGLLGALFGIIFQGRTIPEVFTIMYNGFTSNTGIATLDDLLSGGGLSSMLSLILTIMCAFVFAGIIGEMGLLDVLLQKVSSKIKHPGFLTLFASLTTVLGVYITSSVYVSCIMNSRIWNNAFEDAGLDGTYLGTVLSISGSPIGLLVPWSGGALLMMSLFELSWYQYAPYMIFYWVALILLIALAFRKKRK